MTADTFAAVEYRVVVAIEISGNAGHIGFADIARCIAVCIGEDRPGDRANGNT